MKHAVRRALAAAAPLMAPVIALVAAGCGGEMQEQTQRWYPPANGVNGEAGDIGLRNVLLVADEDGRHATLIAALANRGEDDDQLVEVRVGDKAARIPSGELDVPADGFANISPETNRIDVRGADVTPGRVVEVEFRFASSPRAMVEALVLPADGDYADALPEPTSSATPDRQDEPNEGGAEPTAGEDTENASDQGEGDNH